MANKSTLFINGVQVSEMAGSGKVVYTKKNTVGTRIFLVPWDKRNDIVRFVLGSVNTNEDGSFNVSSAMAFNTDGDPDLFADAISQDPFIANAKEDTNKEIEYEYSVLTVTYIPRDNQVTSVRNSNGTEKQEGDANSTLLMTLKISSSVENITIPDSEKNWSFAESDGVGYGFNSKKLGTVKPGQVSKIVPFLNWTLSYKQIPDIFIKKIRLGLISPLQSIVTGLSAQDGIQTEATRGLGDVRRGTMLFLGFDASQDSVILEGAKKTSKKAWSITYKFKEHPFGWNYIFTGKQDTKAPIGSLPRFGWIPILNKDSKPLYDTSEFNNFLPDLKDIK